MFISTAYAQAPATGTPGLLDGGLVSLLPLVLIFVVFYFLLIRPQQKKMKDHRAMVAALRRGDRVVISDGVRVRVVRSAVNEVLSKTAPAGNRDDEEEEEAAEKKSGN